MKPAIFAPAYCAMYPGLAEIARKHGYALAIHGSMGRDFDLICIPWTETPSPREDVVAEMMETFKLTSSTKGYPFKKLHGRISYVLIMEHLPYSGVVYLDLSFMPLSPETEEAPC